MSELVSASNKIKPDPETKGDRTRLFIKKPVGYRSALLGG